MNRFEKLVAIKIFAMMLLFLSGSLGCRSAGNAGEGESLIYSAGRDALPIEEVIANYGVELNSYDAFERAIDWSNFYEDGESRERTNFVIFNGSSGIECTVGLTTSEMAYLKSHPRMSFSLKSLSPGRIRGLYQSQIVLTYVQSESSAKEDVLIVCSQPNRRISVSDFTVTLKEFIRFTAANDRVPTYEVCCQCMVDTFAAATASDTGVAKNEVRFFLMPESNDSICKTHFRAVDKTAIRPGDRHFSVKQARYFQVTACEEASLVLCKNQTSSSTEKSASRANRTSAADSRPTNQSEVEVP